MANSKRSKQGARTLAINTVDQLKALAHPLRLQLLDKFAAEPKTTKQIAVELGLQPTRLYHHVAKLEAAGLIRLVRTRQVRGTIEKYYSPVSDSLKIDRTAFKSGTAKLLGDILGARVIENLLGMVQEEVAEYLSQVETLNLEGSRPDTMPHEVMFANTEFEIDESKVSIFRNKITQLIEEFSDLAKPEASSSDQRRKYRLIIGWYPRVTGQNQLTEQK